VIRHLDEITPDWLTEVLCKWHPADELTVIGFRILIQKNLPYSRVARLALQYSRPQRSMPGTVFIKLCPGSTTDNSTLSGGKEVDFYMSAAREIGSPPLVKCFDAAGSDGTGHSHILMEDLTETHSQPAENNSPSAEMSWLAVEALARAHAACWNCCSLRNGIGELFDECWLAEFIANLESSTRDFIARSGVVLTDEQRKAYSLMLLNADRIWGRLLNPTGLTITHGDCHWWNFQFPNDADSESVRIIDWQLWHVDLGARDLAFLLALGGFAEPRPELESELLRAYHGTLVASGVSNYSWEKLWDDYRWSAIRNLNIPVIFWSQGKHESTWQTALGRAFDSYARLDCGELLRGDK